MKKPKKEKLPPKFEKGQLPFTSSLLDVVGHELAGKLLRPGRFKDWEDAHVIPALKALCYEVKASKTLRVIRGIEVFVKGRSKKTKVLFYG